MRGLLPVAVTERGHGDIEAERGAAVLYEATTRSSTMNTKQLLMRGVMIAAAGAIGFVDVMPAVAAPVLSSAATVKSVLPDMLDQVRVRRGRGGNIGAGIALGVIGAVAGAAAASRSYDYGPGYYARGYDGGGEYYGSPDYAPRAYSRDRCWITTDSDRNYGYYGSCYR
jgi:hypothetical protein